MLTNIYVLSPINGTKLLEGSIFKNTPEPRDTTGKWALKHVSNLVTFRFLYSKTVKRTGGLPHGASQTNAQAEA